MTQMESPKRKMQKKNDYQRHKLFRKIKRRRKAQAEAEQQIAEKQLRKKLKLPKFDRGEDDGNYLYKSDIHINKDASITDVSTGKRYDGARIPEVVVTARKIPTFKDIEKQIGRKIMQDEINKIVAVDPEIPIELPNVPKEKGVYSPSVTNEFINTVVGTAGDATNYLANKAGLSNLAPNEQLVETRDGDALFDLPGYGQAAKLSLYGLGRYGGKLGLKKLQKLAKQKLLERELTLSNVDKQLAKDIAYSKPGYNHELIISPSKKQKRLQLSQPTYQVYTGNKHKISEVIDGSGNVNLANLLKIQNEALSSVPGGRLARHRLENPDWHKTDWNTFLHSRDAYQRALQAGYPNEALFPTLMHDAGKLWAGDGHGPYGASIVKQIFPDATDEQIMAIYQHMDKVPESSMGKLVKGADISEDNPFRNYSWTNSNDGYPYALRPGQNSWDTNVIQNELQQGRKDLLDWVNNPEFIKAQQANKIEAQNMGLEYIPLHERSTFKDRVALLDNPGTYKWYANNKTNESGYVENPLGDYGSVMNINLANVDPYRFTISHEGGHILGMGGPDLPSNSSQSILSQLKYLKHKSRQVLKPGYWYNNQFDISEYPYEAVQNLRNLGQELKLSVGQEYPGYKNALDIINNSGNTTHSFLKPYLKTDKESMPYVWKALVGTQFGLSPVYLNATNDKSFNSGKDIHIKPSKRGTFTKAAKQHGMSVQGFANRVLRNPNKYSVAMRKKANFAHNVSKWNR